MTLVDVCNRPLSRIGATNKGITQREYTEWLRLNRLPKRSVADILNADARENYWSDYWLEGRCNRMPWPLCLAHFDACVNVGVGQAAKFLQRALGCKDDGAIGPVTLTGLRGALEKNRPVCRRSGWWTSACRFTGDWWRTTCLRRVFWRAG